jgi:pimeloyl-ACP methyl ester carboxylesterase
MLRDALAQIPATTLRQRAAATLRVDVRALLPQIGVPTLCLQAGHDRLLWPPSVAELQTLLPDARHVALGGRICCCRPVPNRPPQWWPVG